MGSNEELQATDDFAAIIGDAPILGVSDITRQIAAALDQQFPLPVWVRGEISNYKGRNQKGHLYFNLKDAEALLPCVFFARQNATLDADIAEGSEVLVCGTLNVYGPHGRYQLVVERLLPAGVGQLHIRFEKLKKKLLAEGLFDEAHKQALPRFPKVVGIITSPTGAVIRDFLKIVGRRYPLVHILVVPTQMQGDGAAASIVASIERLHQCREHTVDMIVLARGGGSIEELWPFNEESVARAIYAAKIPIISAIGHETDVTIADFVADVRAATPTHAAELAVPDGAELLRELHHTTQRMFTTVSQQVALHEQRLERCKSAAVLRFPEKIVVDLRQTLDRLLERGSHHMDTAIQTKQLHLVRASGRMQSLNPLQVLERGFSLVQKPDGKLVRSALELKKGEALRLHLAQGKADVTVLRPILEGHDKNTGSPTSTPTEKKSDDKQRSLL